MRLVLALIAGATLAWALGSCGSGGSGTVAQQARTAASTQQATTPASTTTRAERTATAAKTTGTQQRKTTPTTKTTVTQPQQTVTTTVTQPTQTTPATTVQVVPTSTTGGESGGGGLPWWGWLLIGLGLAAIAIGIFAVGRRHGRDEQHAPSEASSDRARTERPPGGEAE